MAVGELPQELTHVAGAYTPAERPVIPPERITSKSSMLSAPAAIPAMIEVTFPAGFTPAEATRRLTRAGPASASSSDSPACSASAITGTRPAHDTRWASSNSGVALTTSEVVSLPVPSRCGRDPEVDTPDSSVPRRHFYLCSPHANTSPPADYSTDRGLVQGDRTLRPGGRPPAWARHTTGAPTRQRRVRQRCSCTL